MKNILLILLLTSVFAFSCKKSENTPVPAYSQDNLNGTWENIQKDENGCIDQIIIAPNYMSEGTICTGSNISIEYGSYAFDGKKITVMVLGISAEYVINELSDTKLVMTMTGGGMTKKSEYKRK